MVSPLNRDGAAQATGRQSLKAILVAGEFESDEILLLARACRLGRCSKSAAIGVQPPCCQRSRNGC